jgi:hypothetical protein
MGSSNVTTEHVNMIMNDRVANQKMIATVDEVRRAFQSTDTLRYIKNDTYIANPKGLLGNVFVEHEEEGSSKLERFLISVEAVVDKESILKSPQARTELILDTKAMAAVDLFSFISLDGSAEEVYELRVIDNAAARLIDKGAKWEAALRNWMSNSFAKTIITDPTVGSIGIVTGVVQKYITTKKYRKFDVNAKGGAFGVNLAGSLYTSSSEFSLDIVYGLDITYLPKEKSKTDFELIVEKDLKITDSNEISRLNRKFTEMSLQMKDFANIEKTIDIKKTIWKSVLNRKKINAAKKMGIMQVGSRVKLKRANGDRVHTSFRSFKK